MTRMLAIALLSATLSVPVPVPASDPRVPDPAIASALREIHDGRFDEADRVLAPPASGESELPRLFFRAFVTYWRLIYDDDDEGLRRRFEGQLEQALGRAEARLEDDPSDLEARLWEGSTHLLMAQLNAARRKPFAAAFAAKRAKKSLEAATNGEASAVEPLFGLGTYNYVADRVPAFVKGIRALLFLPGGNREVGLEQLQRAARESSYFGLEARLLLVTIYANKNERLFLDALRELREATKLHPDTIAVLDASARLFISLGDPERALDALDRAETRARELSGVDGALLGRLALLRATAETARLRPDRAREAILPLVSRTDLPPSEIGEARNRLKAADESLASAWWRQLSTATPEERRRAAERSDAPAMLVLAVGRQAVLDGDPAFGSELLGRVEMGGALSDSWLGFCRLWEGRAADLLGERRRAVDLYEQAAAGRGFLGRDAAVHHQRVPYRGRTQ